MTQSTDQSTGRAKVRLDARLLADMLDLPEGCRVVAVDARNDPFGVYVIVEGPGLPEVPPDAESPFAHFEAQVDEDRRVLSIRWPEAVTR